jgi:hypothetical protein
MSGVATAPVSSVTVSAHCEAASDTCSACCTVGSSGVPRLATAVDSTARNTSTAASRPGEALPLPGARLGTGITVHARSAPLMLSKTNKSYIHVHTA